MGAGGGSEGRPGVGRGWVAGLCLVGILIAWGAHSALVIGGRGSVPTTPPSGGFMPFDENMRELVVGLHVHTTFSWDGLGTPAEVVKACREKGVGAVLLAEHDNTGAWEAAGYQDGVLVVPGVEVGTSQGHFLLWGVDRDEVDSVYQHHRDIYNRKPTLESIGFLLEHGGGLGVVAHPRGTRRPWIGPIPAQSAGLEIVNGDAEWRNDGLRDLLRAVVFYPLEPSAALGSLIDFPEPAIALWDSLLNERRASGFSGLDAHGGVKVRYFRDLPFPSYEVLLGQVRQHVFVREAFDLESPEAAAELLAALSSGRHYTGYDCFGSTEGFLFWAMQGESQVLMGGEMPWAPGTILAVRAPKNVECLTRIVRQGEVVEEEHGGEVVFAVDRPGAYRVEVLQIRKSPLGGHLSLPWIISNPIYIGEPLDTG